MTKVKQIWLYLIIFAVAISLRIPYLTREFVLEETLHVKVARSIAQVGYPYTYFGEQEQSSQSIFMDRTPMLFFFLAAPIRVFGESEISIRALLLILSLLELSIIIYFTLHIFQKPKVAALAGFLFAVHPYVIQSSLQIHFDDAIFTFFTTWFLFLSLEKIIKKRNSLKDQLQLASILFFVFSIKYETSLMALATVAVGAALIYRPFLLKFLTTSILSILTFFIIFFFYNLSFGHPEQFFTPAQRIVIVSQKLLIPKLTAFEATSVRSLWAHNYYLLIRFLSWLSIPTILLAAYTYFRISQVKKFRRNPAIIFLTVWILVFVVTYLVGGWSGDYPRYFAPAMPALFVLAGAVFAHDFQKLRTKVSTLQLALISIFVTSLLILALKNNYLFLDHITGWIPNLQIPFFIILALTILFTYLATKLKIYATVMVTILLLNFAQLTAQNIHDLKSNYSLTNFYGHGSYRQAGMFLQQTIGDQNKVILTFDPVGYYWGEKYFDYYIITSRADADQTVSILKNQHLDAIALPRLYLAEIESIAAGTSLDFTSFLAENFKNHQNFGGEKGIEIFYR